MGFFDGIGDFFKGIAGPAAGALTSLIPGAGPFLAPVVGSAVGGLFPGEESPQPGLAGQFMPGGAQQPMIDPLALANMNYVNAHRIQQPIKKEANYFGDGLNGLSGRYFA